MILIPIYMNLRNYLIEAERNKWAIGQFNFSNLEILRAVVQAAKNSKSPIILGVSESESRFIGSRHVVAIVSSFKEETGLPLFLNLDHGKDLDYIKEAVDLGYDAVHFDGSSLFLQENIEKTKEIVEYAHRRDALVEGEIDFIPGASGIIESVSETKREAMTDPEVAVSFINETGVDSLAVNIGTFHGIQISGENPHIDIDRLKEIKNKVGNKAFLVLHGGSGTPREDVKEAIKNGIVKININTELRLAFKSALKTSLEQIQEIAPYKYLLEAIEAAQKVVEEKMRLFGSANKIVVQKP